jgi:alpha-tubulin suppressor-like RCC1 family protein
MAGSVHTCALLGGGSVACWGWNAYGQLGNGAITQLPTMMPVAVADLTGVIALCGRDHTCAVVAGGAVRCWGRNSSGQLGNGTSGASATPQVVAGISGATAIACGDAHTCVVVAGGAVRCWGVNDRGQLGNGTGVDSATPVEVSDLRGATALAAASSHTCAVVAGGVRCWGSNDAGQLGNGSVLDSPTPVAVIGVTGATAVSAASVDPTNATTLATGGVGAPGHSCAIVAGGVVRCWGSNHGGQLGNGTTIDSPLSVAVTGLGGATAIAAGGESFTCAIVAGGVVRCWGSNFFGQLGDCTVQESTTPVTTTGW